MQTSLQSLPSKKLTTGHVKLSAAGISPRMWLAMLDADEAVMARLKAAWPVPDPVYDAVALFGFGEASAEPLPDAERGEIVIRYGGWSLRELCSSAVIREKNLMWEQDWYHKYEWSNEKLPAGIYRLRVPVPNSNRKTHVEQEQLLLSGEQTGPVVLVATALLAHRMQTGEDLLKNDWTRCKEQAADGRRVALIWDEGRLYVYFHWDGSRHDYVWSSSVRAS